MLFLSDSFKSPTLPISLTEAKTLIDSLVMSYAISRPGLGA